MGSGAKYFCQSLALQTMRLLFASHVVLMLSACGEVTDPQVDTSSAENKIDMMIANALYFDERTPDSFYKEALQDDIFYTISHVKNTSLLPIVDRTGLAAYDLSSDDFVEALLWSDKAAEYQLSYALLADNTETELYYQFTRFNPNSPQFINMHRVFKASVLDRDGVDIGDEDGDYKGRIAIIDLTAEKVKLIVEYLWMFTLSNNYRNAVIESYTTESEDEFVHVMKQARLDLSYSEACDVIKVYEIRYTVPKVSGFIWKDKVLTHLFTTKRTGDYVDICE